MTSNLPASLVFPAVLFTLAMHASPTLAQETTESPLATGPATTTFVTSVTRVES